MSGENRSENPGSEMSRRKFLGMSALGITSAALHSFAKPAVAQTDRSGRPYCMVRTAEFFGDAEIRLTFPQGFELDVLRMPGHDAPGVTDDQILTALREPVGTQPLADLAAGKKTVCITFDDLTRPTPMSRVVPSVLAELRRAGIKDENIIFQGSFGSHSAMYQQDMAAKLGSDIVANYACWNYDPFHGNTEVGTTPEGNKVELNSRFVNADLKICLHGIKKHGLAGYGGGGKALIPGIASFDCIHYMHNVVNGRHQTASAWVNNPVRLDIETAIDMVGVDMSVNLVMNGHREVAAVVAGHMVGSHRAAVRIAHENYNTQMPDEPADVIVANAYPQSVEAYFSWGAFLKPGGTYVLIQDTPAGQRKIHYLGWSGNGGNLAPQAEKGIPVQNAAKAIIFNRFAAKWDELRYSKEVQFATSWDQVYDELAKTHGPGTKVAVLPTGKLSHPGLELRM